MTTDPLDEQAARDAQFWTLSAEAERIAAQADPGRPEVERLAAIVDQMHEILDELPQERLRKFRSRLHEQRGRAIDLPPKLPPGPPALKPYDGRTDHIHWAYDSRRP